MYSLRADTTEPQPAIRAAKLQKVESNTKHIYLFLLPRRSNFDITDVKVTKKACNERRKYETYSCLSPVFFASFLPHYLSPIFETSFSITTPSLLLCTQKHKCITKKQVNYGRCIFIFCDDYMCWRSAELLY